VGLVTSVTATQIGGETQLLGLAGLFVVVEVVALVFFDDDFWGRPLAGLASFAEALAAVGTALAGVGLVFAPLLDPLRDSTLLGLRGDVTLGSTLALMALGWLTADVRRVDPAIPGLRRPLVRGSGWLPATVALAVSLAGAVEVGTASGLATGVALMAISVALLTAGRVGAIGVAAVMVPWAVAVAATHPAAVLAIGGTGALALAGAAGRARDSANRVFVAIDATGVAVAAALLGADVLGASGSVAAAAGAVWVLALVLDAAAPGEAGAAAWRLGDVARLGLLAPLALATALAPAHAIGPLVAIAALYTLDAVRQDRPMVAFGAAAAVQPLIVALAKASGLSDPWAGFALCLCAVAWSGLAAVIDDRWRAPFLAAAGSGVALGLALAQGDPEVLSDSLLLVGGIGIAAGLLLRQAPVGHAGGAVATAGLVGHLILAGVTASEPFVAPVAVQLVVAGWQAQRRHHVSSWIAYVPAVALLGGAALAERIGGGAGWHALVAGGVGVLAVAVGGWRRLAGPMVVGTALLTVLTVRESLSALAGVPTWAWLGLGGTLLLGTAVVLERSDASPLEAGRRVVEVLAERFE
jgi:hypothetical protein